MEDTVKRFGKILAVIFFLLIALIVAVVVIAMNVDYNEYKPQIQAEAKKATGRDLVIEGDLKLNIFTLSPGLAVNGVRFQNAKWGSRPDMAKIDRFEAVVSIMPLLSGAIEVRRIVLEGADILIEKNKAGQGNYEFSVGDKKTEKAVKKATTDKPAAKSGGDMDVVIQAVTIKKAKLTYKDYNAPKPLEVAIDEFTVKGQGKSDPLEILLKGGFNKAAFSAKDTLGSPAELMKPTKPWPINLTMEAGGATIKVNGAIANPQKASGINIALSVEGDDLSKMSELAQGPVPPLGPYSVSARVAGDVDKSIAISALKAKVGSSSLAGKLNVVLPGRPRVAGSFLSDKLDLADFVKGGGSGGGSGGSGGGAGGAAKGQFVIPDTPLPVDGLKAADADLDFDIKELVAAPSKVEDIKITLRLNNGDLKVTPVTMKLAGGDINAGLHLNAATAVPSLTTNLSVKKMSLSQLASQMGQKDLMDGDIDIAMNMAGSGKTPHQIASVLNGAFSLEMGKGKIKTETLEQTMGQALTMLTKVVAGNKPIYTVINCGVKKLEIKNGLSTSKAMVFDSDWLALLGSGTVDLKTEKIDYAVNPDIKIAGPSAGVPLKIHGTLAKPDYTLDALAVAGKAIGMVGKVGGGALGNLIGSGGSGSGSSGGSKTGNPCVDFAQSGGASATTSPTKAITDNLKSKAEEKVKEQIQKQTTDKVKEGVGGAVGDTIKGLFGR
jgi:uncharacterized protein involved in outer membrane biogenesis